MLHCVAKSRFGLEAGLTIGWWVNGTGVQERRPIDSCAIPNIQGEVGECSVAREVVADAGVAVIDEHGSWNIAVVVSEDSWIDADLTGSSRIYSQCFVLDRIRTIETQG